MAIKEYKVTIAVEATLLDPDDEAATMEAIGKHAKAAISEGYTVTDVLVHPLVKPLVR